ncbi:DUF1707 SHOCT-like domain-containing protein [Prescottella subtropica]|uniref:DUF1707 SHOCT-like domain-containing protein n=1 Tax=Prescottella subtropica TaxID=2545757 RepID=UPI001F5015F2|nr:DUF1707 domain-containing protein [Prescottella subtropica]
MRARDRDRVRACTLLDAGYGDGQLDEAEHRARTEKAMEASTLRQLAALVADLQVPEHLTAAEPAPESAAPVDRRIPVRAVAAVAVAVVAVLATAQYTNRGGAASDPVSVAEPAPAGEPEPIVIEPLDPVSPAGVRDFLHRYEEKFEDLRVDDVIFFPDYTMATRMLADQPHREQEWVFRGGFSAAGQPDSRDMGTVDVDLADLDVDRLADVLATGPGRVGLLSATVEHIHVRPTLAGDVLVSVLFEDREERTGMIDTRMDGTVVDVFPVEDR